MQLFPMVQPWNKINRRIFSLFILAIIQGCTYQSDGKNYIGRHEHEIMGMYGNPTTIYMLPDGGKMLQYEKYKRDPETFIYDPKHDREHRDFEDYGFEVGRNGYFTIGDVTYAPGHTYYCMTYFKTSQAGYVTEWGDKGDGCDRSVPCTFLGLNARCSSGGSNDIFSRKDYY